jgi:hypothetical protein
VPKEKFNRQALTPALNNDFSPATVSHAGPMVAIILVLLILMPYFFAMRNQLA